MDTASSPIFGLANELLLAIIEIELQPYHGLPQYYPRLREVSQISSRWRTIVNGTPFLWRWLVNSQDPQLIPECMEMSQRVPLIINFMIEDASNDYLDDYYRLIIPSLSRCESLKLDFGWSRPREHEAMPSKLFDGDMPLLLDLELLGDPFRINVVAGHVLDLASLRAPRVERIYLRQFGRITLTQAPSRTLRHLHIHQPAQTLVTQYILNLLSSILDLRSFTMYARSIQSAPETATQMASLASLETVDVTADSDFFHVFLSHVDTPCLRRLRLQQLPSSRTWFLANAIGLPELTQHLTPIVCRVIEVQPSSLAVHMTMGDDVVFRVTDPSGENPVDLYLAYPIVRTDLTVSLSWLNQVLNGVPCKSMTVSLTLVGWWYDFAHKTMLQNLASVPNLETLVISDTIGVIDLLGWLGNPLDDRPDQWPLPKLSLLSIAEGNCDFEASLVQMAQARYAVHPFKLSLPDSDITTILRLREVMGDGEVLGSLDGLQSGGE